MPVVNGYEAVKQIKEFKPNLPIIAQTAYSSQGDLNRANSVGCDNILIKPISEENLSELLKKYLLSNEGS